MEAYHKKQEEQLLTHLKPLDLYMEMREEGGARLENIRLLTSGVHPRFKCGDSEGLDRNRLMALYRKYRPLNQFRVHVDYVGEIWDFLFVKRGYLADRSLGWIMRSCSPEEIAMAGQPLEALAAEPHDSPAFHTRSKTVQQANPSFAFESNENKIIVEDDCDDMPALITIEHIKTLEALESKERTLQKEAKELDQLEVKVAEIRALSDAIGPRRMIWICEELAHGEAGLDALKVAYEKEAAELDALEAKVAAVQILKATVAARRATLVAAANSVLLKS
jgi:hypothetical protein